MHAPTMQVRHGENARNLAEQPAFETIFQQGMLIRVHKHDMWLAGCLCQIEPSARKLNARLIGVKGGDDEYRSQGAQSFVYHAIIDWAIDSGAIDTVDFQGCEPFLTKGTFQFKRRFGARVVIPDNLLGMLRMLIRPNHSARSARDFLINNPVLTDQPANDLIVKYFRDATHPPRLDLPFESPGIAGSVVLDLDEL
jgi:hypothetical protein